MINRDAKSSGEEQHHKPFVRKIMQHKSYLIDWLFLTSLFVGLIIKAVENGIYWITIPILIGIVFHICQLLTVLRGTKQVRCYD